MVSEPFGARNTGNAIRNPSIFGDLTSSDTDCIGLAVLRQLLQPSMALLEVILMILRTRNPTRRRENGPKAGEIGALRPKAAKTLEKSQLISPLSWPQEVSCLRRTPSEISWSLACTSLRCCRNSSQLLSMRDSTWHSWSSHFCARADCPKPLSSKLCDACIALEARRVDLERPRF